MSDAMNRPTRIRLHLAIYFLPPQAAVCRKTLQVGKPRFSRRRYDQSFENFAFKNPYQDLMSEQDLPLPGDRPCNRKIESIIGGEIVKIVSMDVYPCGDSCSKPVGTNIVKISEANYRDNPDLCMKIVIGALLSLPAAIYTIVYHTAPLPCVMDFRVGDKGCGLRVRPLDRETINSIKQPACLRIQIE
jgi:hypothetical protein